MKRTNKPMQMSDNLLLLRDELSKMTAEELGAELSDKISMIRQIAQDSETTGADAYARLEEIISSLKEDELLSVIRFFNQSLNLLNTVEQLDLISEYAKGSESPIQFVGLCQELINKGVSREAIIETLEASHMDLVLTAHPTERYKELTKETPLHTQQPSGTTSPKVWVFLMRIGWADGRLPSVLYTLLYIGEILPCPRGRKS